ncbi:hypothetical protein MMC27_001346 [Xylographa pallens]|nr:hypothetical protein [Xylographa pallens]
MACGEWDSQSNKQYRTLVRMLIPKFSDHKDLLTGKPKDPATMDRKGGQGARKQERPRPRVQAEGSEEEHAAARAQLMLNDLGLDRASFVTAGDVARNSRPVDVMALEHGRAFRRPGTAAYAAAQENEGQLSAWSTVFKQLKDDGADDGKAELSNGQEHRSEMMQKLQQAASFAGNRGGGQGGRARGSGRGGGVMGTRGRGDRTVSSSQQHHTSQLHQTSQHHQTSQQHHTSQAPNRRAPQNNTASQSLAAPTVTGLRSLHSSPRNRGRSRGSASPRGRDDRRAESSTITRPSNPHLSAGRAFPSPIETSLNPSPRQRWLAAVAERTSVDPQTQVRPPVRPPLTRPTRSPPNLANPDDFMTAMAHLHTSNSGAMASGSTPGSRPGVAVSGSTSGAAASGSTSGATASGPTEIRVEGASTVTVKETAKSTVTESSGSISVKTAGTDHEIISPPEIIFSPEIDAAPYGVRVLTPPPVSQRSISPGTYSEDLIGLEIEVPCGVKAEDEPADDKLNEAHLNSSEQARSTTEQAISLSDAQTLLNTLRGLSGLSSLPSSVAGAIADLEATIGKSHETNATTLARNGADITGPVDSSSADSPVMDIGHIAARSSGNAQGSGHHVPAPRKSSSDSAASQPSITASSHPSSSLSQSGNISVRLQRMQAQWATGVMDRLREVLSISMTDLDQSLHHDPIYEFQQRVSTRLRLPMTNLGEHLLPVGSLNEQTAPLSIPEATPTENEAARNTVIRGQIPASCLQESRSSNSLEDDFFTKAARKQDAQKTVYDSQDLHASAPQDGTNIRSGVRNTAAPRPINPFQQQVSAAVTLPSQSLQNISFHRRAPTSTSMASFPGEARTNTVDAVRRTILPNIAPVNPFSQPTSAFSTLSAPHFTFSHGLPTALSHPAADASFNPRITISPHAQRLPRHPTVVRDAETASNTASNMPTRIAPSTFSTIPSTVAPLSAAPALAGGVGASRWSTATSNMPSTLVAASSTAPQLPASTALSGGVSASRWSTASSALSSTSIQGTGVTAPLATAAALDRGVSASRWSTTTDADLPVQELRSITNLQPSSGHSQSLRGTGPGSSGNSTSVDLGLNDTTSLFSNYQRPQGQHTPNVPGFILQAQALQTDPGAAARAQYGIANTTRPNISENQPLSPPAVSVPESASSNVTSIDRENAAPQALAYDRRSGEDEVMEGQGGSEDVKGRDRRDGMKELVGRDEKGWDRERRSRGRD